MNNETPQPLPPMTRPDPKRVARGRCPSWCSGSHLHDRPNAVLHRGELSSATVRTSVEFEGSAAVTVCLTAWDVESGGIVLRYPPRVEVRSQSGETLLAWDTAAEVARFAAMIDEAAAELTAEHDLPNVPLTDATAATSETIPLQAWIEAMTARGMSARTIGERRRLIERLTTELATEPTAWTTEQLRHWFADQRQLSQGSRATYFAALRSWFGWLVRTGARSDDPMRALDAPKPPRRQPRPVTTAQIERLLASGIRQRTRAMILLGAFQGFRVHEIAKVRGDDIDGDRIRVVGKGGVVSWLPLHPAVAELAASMPSGYWFPNYADGEPITAKNVSNVISKALQRAGVPATAHQLRHWYATELVRSGTDLRTTQTLMRHANLNTTAGYAAVDSDAQLAAVTRLPTLKD